MIELLNLTMLFFLAPFFVVASATARQAPAQAITNPALLDIIKKGRGYNLLLSDDGKCAYYPYNDGYQPLPLIRSDKAKRLSIKAFRDPKSLKITFYSSQQKVPPALAKYPDSTVQFDSAWAAPDNHTLVMSGHVEEGEGAKPDKMYVVVLDWDAKRTKPLDSAFVHLANEWGLYPLAVRMKESRIRWWVLGPARGEEADIIEYNYDIGTGHQTRPNIDRLANLRFQLYSPESGTAADYNSLLHYVLVCKDGSTNSITAHTPKGCAGFALTPKSVLVSTFTAEGKPDKVYRLNGGSFTLLGSWAIEGFNASGELCVIRDVKSGRISIVKI